MNAISPVVPLFGMANVLFLGLAVLVGFAFGFFLERAGFGSAKNLSSIFILRDFRVFRVMFSAVITAMLGSQLLSVLGVLDIGLLHFDPNYFWAMLAGGLVFGVGFYVGGFCPGTAVVALVRGRWDGAAFLFGIILGIYGFALLFDAVGQNEWFANFYAPADAQPEALYGDGSVWPWVLGLTAVALVGFKLTPFIEKRFGLRTVEQLEAAKAGEAVPPNTPPQITGWLVKFGPAVAMGVGVAVLVFEIGLPDPIPHVEAASPVPVAVEVDESPAPSIDPLTLASWTIAEEYRRAAEEPPNALIIDTRAVSDRERSPIPGALALDLDADDDQTRLAQTLKGLRDILTSANRNKPVVFVDGADDEATIALVEAMRRRGINAMVLEGGAEAWQAQVLSPDAVWPDWQLSGSDLADIQQHIREWLAGESDVVPPRLAIPGTILLPAKPATVQPTGGAGGGCG